MKILSHRGLWKTAEEKNSRKAFIRSFSAGYGTETDVRDICGKLVISHDMPQGNEITFEEVLQIMEGRNLPLAINIKADGLIEPLLELLNRYHHTNYFTFDMSIPDLVVQTKRGAKVFTGQSDIMPTPVLLDKCYGIWLDAFFSDWYDSEFIDGLLSNGKQLCVVSADLHKRDPIPQWKKIKRSLFFERDSLMLCTDMPDKAKEFFSCQ